MKARPESQIGFIEEHGWIKFILVVLVNLLLIFFVYLAVTDLRELLVILEKRPPLISYSRTSLAVLATNPLILLITPIGLWARLVSMKWVNEIVGSWLALFVLSLVVAIFFVMPYFKDRLQEAGYHLCGRHAELSKTNPVRGWKEQAWVLDPNDCRK